MLRVRNAMAVAVMLGGLAGGDVSAQETGRTAMVADPCVGVIQRPLAAPMTRTLDPNAKPPPQPPTTPEQVAATAKTAAEARAFDFPNLCRYRAANASLQVRPDVVFMGDSITEIWPIADPEIFSDKVIGRGISGQTTPQMLVRFRADVVALRPRLVHIMAGTNDIAGNTGLTNEADYKNNIAAMAELAKVGKVKVALASILPMAVLSWVPQYQPAAEVRRLNSWLREYAAANRLQYIDYYTALSTPDGAFKPELSNDGVHPNKAGYAVMREIAVKAMKLR